jgi:hypothetical protein
VKEANKSFFTDRLQSAFSSKKELFSTFSQLIGSKKCVLLPTNILMTDLPETFACYFADKISAIRAGLDSSHCADNLSHYYRLSPPLLQAFLSIDELT